MDGIVSVRLAMIDIPGRRVSLELREKDFDLRGQAQRFS